ncbi:phosphoribosylanthranilate isomerase [Halorussus limi]|uniref:N-(5'-phosphoribosyl)anthranilate isomerase n=1 Tax=Halorussus limi TaxID=2938695 RepID=A0A8U0HW39_9EURY|nr:phosphoribosylanthranilate isomerase [Halorussus limi]UPV74906.1 phosphoribosylanthranilate isomerase [Halorussus limi]
MTRVKICGLTSTDDLRVAVEAGADAVGLLVDVPVDSPREIDPQRAVEIAEAAPPFVTTVLVTMPESPDRAVELARAVEPDAVQVHGEMGVGDLAYLTASVEAKVIKVVDAGDPDEARRYDEVADALLVDSVDDDGAGGTGQTHDWDRTAEVVSTLDSPVVLAGGLTPTNVADAVRTVEPFAVDVASGVDRDGVGDETASGETVSDETPSADGRKDPDAVADFVANAKRTHSAPTP